MIFHILIRLLVLPTEFLRAPSARRETPMVVYKDLHTDVKSEYLGAGGNPVATYSVGASTKFVSRV